MRLTAIFIPAGETGETVFVPALPGCVSEGNTRAEALANAREAALGWLEAEAHEGRGPVEETASLLARATAEALEIIEEMRAAGELPSELGFPLELLPLDVPSSALV